MKPLVTILIPTYNRRQTLGESVESALQQTYSNLEIIILDDASPDDTAAVANAYSERDERVRYVRHPTNVGITENWREGFRLATGEFVCILHDDDTFETNFVEELVQPLLENMSLTFSFSDHWVMSAEGQRQAEATEQASQQFRRDTLQPGPVSDLAKAALLEFCVPIGATLIRRSAVKQAMFKQEAKGAIDYWLIYELIRNGATASYVSKRLMNYRVHGGSMSGGRPFYMAEGHMFRLNSAMQETSLAGIRPGLKNQYAHVMTEYGITLLRHGRSSDARKALATAFRANQRVRTAVALGLSLMGPIGRRILNVSSH